MKRITALLLMILMVGASLPARAMTPAEQQKAHFQEMKAIKDKQRVDRDAEKKNEAANSNAKKEKGFWEKEGERSGLGGGNRAGHFLSNLNPVPFFKDQDERYKARKAATGVPQK